MNFLKTLIQIPVIAGSKIPAVSGWATLDYIEKPFETNKYDIGIITGSKNNIFVLDVDIKDDGLKTIQDYIKINGDINTLTVKTPSGGLHYYFNYKSSNDELNYLINTYITNKTKYRGVGLDIRTNGGYIKAPPSKGYEVIKETLINDITEHLLLWLLEDIKLFKLDVKQGNQTTNKQIMNQTQYKYDIDETKLNEIISVLDSSYSSNYDKWFKLLTVFKNLSFNTFDTFKLFDTYSSGCKSKYNKETNFQIWNSNKGLIDINYLIKLVNREQKLKLPLIAKFKESKSSNHLDFSGYKTLTINKQYLEYDEAIFNTYDTILIESTLGTSKTTSTAQYTKKYIDANPNIKFISLVNLIKLNEQQLETFNKAGLKLLNYQDYTADELIDNNSICCINSIHNKLNWLDDPTLNNYIVYIDEISSFIDSLLYNDKLNKNLSQTNLLLMKIIKNCYKLVISDAIITPNVLNLIAKRKGINKIYIKNEFKKYEGIEAIKCNDENNFFNLINTNISNDNYFLFGADSKTTITKYYNEYVKMYPQSKEKFLLITADTNIKLYNVEAQFKNKFVFFSPSITTGINFDIDIKQDVFIYINGKTISPAASFQQTGRTRNINKLYYYSNVKEKTNIYNSLDEVETTYKNRIETNEKLLNLSGSVSVDDELVIVENTFFKLFCSGIYQQDTEQTNKLLHFEDILKKQGFKLSSQGVIMELKKELKKGMGIEMKENKLELLEQFIKDVNRDEVDIYLNIAYKSIREKFEFLRLNVNDIKDYEFLLLDDFKFTSFFNFVKMNQTSEYLKEKYEMGDNMAIKKLDEVGNKILLFRKFEVDNGIKPNDINFLSSDIKLNTSDKDFLYLKTVFRITKSKPKTTDELKKVYCGMIRNIYGNLDILKSKQRKKDNIFYYEYSFDKELMDKLYILIVNMNISNLDENRLNLLGYKIPELEKKNYNNYLFCG